MGYRPPSYQPYKPQRQTSTEVKGNVAEARYPEPQDPMAQDGMDDDADTGSLVQQLRGAQEQQRRSRTFNAIAEFLGTVSGDDRVIAGALRQRQQYDQEIGELRSAIDQRRTARALARQQEAEREQKMYDLERERNFKWAQDKYGQDNMNERAANALAEATRYHDLSDANADSARAQAERLARASLEQRKAEASDANHWKEETNRRLGEQFDQTLGFKRDHPPGRGRDDVDKLVSDFNAIKGVTPIDQRVAFENMLRVYIDNHPNEPIDPRILQAAAGAGIDLEAEDDVGDGLDGPAPPVPIGAGTVLKVPQ